MNREEALKLLQDSREEIDEIDELIIELIIKRTAMAQEIGTAKKVLNRDIENTEREDYIQEKIKKIAKKKKINENSLLKIMDILMELNKSEQEKILRR